MPTRPCRQQNDINPSTIGQFINVPTRCAGTFCENRSIPADCWVKNRHFLFLSQHYATFTSCTTIRATIARPLSLANVERRFQSEKCDLKHSLAKITTLCFRRDSCVIGTDKAFLILFGIRHLFPHYLFSTFNRNCEVESASPLIFLDKPDEMRIMQKLLYISSVYATCSTAQRKLGCFWPFCF